MKKLLSIIMGLGFVLSPGLVYAEEGTEGTTYPSEKMIRNEDLPRLNLDQDRATVNQMPAEPDSEGSAAGGVTSEPESGGSDIDRSKEPVDIVPAAPEEEGTGAGEADKTPERSGY